jgi:hypothetical protein
MANRTKTPRSLDASFLQLSPTRMSLSVGEQLYLGCVSHRRMGWVSCAKYRAKFYAKQFAKWQSRNSLWLRRCSSDACENNYPDVSGVIFPTIVAIRCCFSSSFWPGGPL